MGGLGGDHHRRQRRGPKTDPVQHQTKEMDRERSQKGAGGVGDPTRLPLEPKVSPRSGKGCLQRQESRENKDS